MLEVEHNALNMISNSPADELYSNPLQKALNTKYIYENYINHHSKEI